MFGRGKSPVNDKIEVIIGPTASFEGNLSCQGSVRIDGIYQGVLDTPSNVVIGEAAKVMADITAHRVSISGAVQGKITAKRVEILDTAHVWADIVADSFLSDEGSYIRGHVTMNTAEAEPPFLIEAPDGEEKEEETTETESSTADGDEKEA